MSSGLGGMSGAQPKATSIIGAIGVFAEVDLRAIKKRHEQGWVQEIISDLDVLVDRICALKAQRQSRSIAFHGNIVDLWEKLAEYTVRTGKLLVELGVELLLDLLGCWPLAPQHGRQLTITREERLLVWCTNWCRLSPGMLTTPVDLPI